MANGKNKANFSRYNGASPSLLRRPFLKRRSYSIPLEYQEEYEKEGVTTLDESVILYHLTQFGGFRLRKNTPDLDVGEGFMDRWAEQRRDGRYTSIRPSRDFLDRLGHLEQRPLRRRWAKSPVKQGLMIENEFSAEEIMAAKDFLDKLNEFYSDSVRLEIDAPQTGLTSEDRVLLSRFHGIPFLEKSARAGGRFIHPESSYQTVSSYLRPFITLNGNQTSEVDLSASTLQFFDICAEESLGRSVEGLSAQEDPYDYFGNLLNSDEFLLTRREMPISRGDLKKLVYTLLYSGASTQESNVNHRLRHMGHSYQQRDLESFFPDFFEVLAALKSKTKRLLHHTLFREEARYAQEVLEFGCLQEGLPILPIHDSFMVQSQDVERLKRLLDESSERLYGKKLKHKQKY